jgi:heme exporter protein B
MSWYSRATGVTLKDLRSEFKTRYALSSLAMFVVTTIAIMLFGTAGETLTTGTQAGLLWTVMFFTAMAGLGRVFIAEEERGTALLLRMLAPSGAVFGGKLAFNMLVILAMNAATAVVYVTMMKVDVRTPSLFAATLLAGSLGLSSASTIVAAIIARARSKGSLYAVLSFPLLVPLVLLVVDATRMSFDGIAFSGEAMNDVLLLLAYSGLVIGVSSIVFDVIWKD